jgi:hypothetical protein
MNRTIRKSQTEFFSNRFSEYKAINHTANMPSRKRSERSEEGQQLPLREKRRRTQEAQQDHDLDDRLSHLEEPVARRGLRSNPEASTTIRLNDTGSPELATKQMPVVKSSHVRFGSESPPPSEPSALVMENAENGLNEDEDRDSDDDAPEAISHSRAQAETKAAAAVEARMLRKREEDERTRRRNQDSQLKKQAQSSKKRQRQEDLTEEGTSKRQFDFDHLPNLLPEELLATEAPKRSPTPPAGDALPQRAQTLKGFGKRRNEEVPPADVVHKGTKIRVLPKTNKALPPRTNAQSKNIREHWMKGLDKSQQKDRRGGSVAIVRRRAGPAAFA